VRKDYELGEVLASGGFGTVSAGWRLRDDLPVALKVVEKSGIPLWEDQAKKIPMEIAILERLSAVPNVIRLLEWLEDEESFLLVLERPTPCQDMYDYIQENIFIPETRARDFFHQIIQIVTDLETEGVYHHDLKSENLLITYDDYQKPILKLIDFGAADKISDEPQELVNGTPHYYPPEYFLGFNYYGYEAMLWTLGMLLYDMTNGHLPFDSKDEIIDGRFTFESDPVLSDSLKDLVTSLLDHDPSSRPKVEEILSHPWMVNTD
ncbi:UNVERIFIED_CONTAM: hypothetical protein GTU68_021135, partial [Idotea baltica]|nr:hypothetical protein [Idotea baltica]